MNTRIKFYQQFLLLCLLLSLAACTMRSGGRTAAVVDPPSREPIILTFATTSWEQNLYESRLEAFYEQYPHITIEFISIDEIFGDRPRELPLPEGEQQESPVLTLARRADVISWYIYQADTPDGALLDLASFMANDESLTAADFYPGLLDQYAWDGGVWGVPTLASYGMIFYNKDIFDAAGVAYPQAGWTWDDMLVIAQALTKGSGLDTQYGFANQSIGVDVMLQSQVGPIFDYDNDVPTARFNDPAVVAAYQWYVDLYQRHKVSIYPAIPQDEQGYAEFDRIYRLVDEGKVAMWPEFSDSWIWRKEQQQNIGMVPFPVSQAQPNSTPILSINGSLVVSAGTQHPREAWAWVKFLTEQGKIDQANSFPNTLLPARRSVADATGVWGQLDQEVAEPLRYAAEHGFTPTYGMFGSEAFYAGFEQIMLGEKGVAEVLDEAQETFDMETEKWLAEGGKTAEVPEFVVAPPPSSQIGADDMVVNFAVGGGDPAIFREMADAFNKTNRGVFVRIVDPNYYDSTDASLRSLMIDADCFQWWNVPTSPEDIAAVLPLQPFFDADPELTESDFFSTVLDSYRVQGQIIGLPHEAHVPLLTYNKRVFDAAGVAYPTADWTIDQFLELAVATTTGDDPKTKIYGFSADIYEYGDMMAFMERQGATLIDANQEPPAFRFNDPAVVAAMRWYIDLGNEYGVKPVFSFGPDSDPYTQRQQMIESDQVAMWTGDPFYAPGGSESATKEHFGYVPYPQGGGGGAGFTSSTGFFISAHTEVHQGCWQWLKYLTEQVPPTPYAGVPGRISTASSSAYTQQVGAEKAAASMHSLQSGGRTSDLGRIYQTVGWLNPPTIWLQQAFDQAMAGEATIEDGLQAAQEKANLYRQCIIENEYFGDDYLQWEECMKVADPKYGPGEI